MLENNEAGDYTVLETTFQESTAYLANIDARGLESAKLQSIQGKIDALNTLKNVFSINTEKNSVLDQIAGLASSGQSESRRRRLANNTTATPLYLTAQSSQGSGHRNPQ